MQSSDFLKDCSKELKSALLEKQSKVKFELRRVDEKLTLFLNGQSFFCDFLSTKYLVEVRQNHSRSESVYSFLRSLSKNKSKLSVLDLTAGLGSDLFKFVLAGHKVKAFERDPVLFLLLQDGLKRFYDSNDLDALKKRFQLKEDFDCELYFGDSQIALKSTNERYDLSYFDPMFGGDKRRKAAPKAAPKKYMQMIKGLVSETQMDDDKIDDKIDDDKMDDDKGKIIKKALSVSDRVVLKASKLMESELIESKLKPQRIISFKGFNYYLFTI